MPHNDLVRYRSGEWSALYSNGRLVKYGDHYVVDEWISSYLNVDERYDDDSFLAEDRRTVYQTLSEVENVATVREARMEEAAKLREQAALLLQTAADLEKRA